MTIDEAARSLQERLSSHPEDAGIFYVYPSGSELIVNVAFTYRISDVEKFGGEWEGFKVKLGRRNC